MFKVGIIGAGHIAEKMATTLHGMDGVEAYAVASRQLEKAQEFASRRGFTKAYGSYEELADDPQVDLVYVATPHTLQKCALRKGSRYFVKRLSRPMP